MAGPGWEPEAGSSDHLGCDRHLPVPVRWRGRWPGPKPKPSKRRSLKGKMSSRDIAADAKPRGLGRGPGTWFGSRTSQSNLQHLPSSWSSREAGGERAAGGRQVWGRRESKGTCRMEAAAQALPAACPHSPRGPTSGAHVQRGGLCGPAYQLLQHPNWCPGCSSHLSPPRPQ